MVIDIRIGKTPIGSELVKQFNAKVKDVKPTESWLISVPGLNEEASTLIRNVNLQHVEGATLLEAVETFQAKSNVKSYVEQ